MFVYRRDSVPIHSEHSLPKAITDKRTLTSAIGRRKSL